MIPIAPLPGAGAARRAERLRFALRHPGRWLTDLSGGGPAYALAILFGFNMVEEMDRDAFGLLTPNIQSAFHLSYASVLSLVAVAGLVGLSLTVPIAQWSDTGHRVRLMLWFQASRPVPVSSSRAISGAPQKMPRIAGAARMIRTLRKYRIT